MGEVERPIASRQAKATTWFKITQAVSIIRLVLVTFSASNLQSPFTTPSLTAGNSYLFSNFGTLTASGSGGTDTVTLTLDFTQPPGGGTVNQGGSGTEYSFGGFFATGTVTWDAPQYTDATGTYSQDLVTFANGASADVDIYNVSLPTTFYGPTSGTLEVRIADVSDPTSIPEPSTIALFASGLLGLGLVGRRRRSF